jgi:hypothetical protein
MTSCSWLQRSRAYGTAALGCLAAGAIDPAHARVTQLDITTVESPTFGGQSFGSVGTYERIEGTYTGEVDPDDFHNAGIVDIQNAPRNANGTVTYTADFQIIRPTNLAQGNHRILFELPNRGITFAMFTFNDTPSANLKSTAGSAGNGFLMNQGYTLVEGGWDLTVPIGSSPFLFGVGLPVATNKDGSPITGVASEELVVDESGTVASQVLTYPAASLDPSQASMTVRENYADSPVTVPPAASAPAGTVGWQYVDNEHVELVLNGAEINFGAPNTYSPTALYEFTYIAKNPLVAGLGFAATRDLATFLRTAQTDDFAVANPMAGDVQKIYTYTLSQPSRTLHDFLLLGFNEADLSPIRIAGALQPSPAMPHQMVFDGIFDWIGGPGGIFMNYRFAQPTRTHRQHIARWTPEEQFPFAMPILTDAVTGQTNGRLARCQSSGTCPNMFEINSENEYWAKGGSNLTTDGQGHDLDLAATPNVRYYQMASMEHTGGPASVLPPIAAAGICQQATNPIVPNVVFRALLLDLDAWVTDGIAPPPNNVPTISAGTLVPPDQSAVGFPSIPGVTFNGNLHTGDLWNFGPQFAAGILSILPPAPLGSPYQIFVPKTDADGNDIAGIKLPEITVPTATHTGWNLRAEHAGQPEPMIDGCDAAGMQIPFAPTAASRQPGGPNAGDPRLSLAERYPNNAAYVAAINAAANQLVAQRLMLPQDAAAYVTAAQAAQIP